MCFSHGYISQTAIFDHEDHHFPQSDTVSPRKQAYLGYLHVVLECKYPKPEPVTTLTKLPLPMTCAALFRCAYHQVGQFDVGTP
jgi:hypothetical protein